MTADKLTTPVDSVADWIAAYRHAHANAEQWSELANRAKEKVTAALGDAEIGTIDGKPAVRYTIVHKRRLNTTKLREQHPDLVDAFTTPAAERRFSLIDKDSPAS
ncbi:hypothetical protein GCM10010174_61930 [Kutzneria viridogrisea]|uniref:Phage-related endonuclease n=1 Tax=Kutzneria viridogrisea TaxID=47990 RepID=A0ABR6BG90_9PSEU|nr:putative phage-related endonuclease [Kutzneria viridogrisea]